MPGILCPHCLQRQLVNSVVSLYAQLLHAHFYFMLIFVIAGTLISHEKLLLQINTEREMGNMEYKLGQV